MMLVSCALLDLSSELCCYWCSAVVWLLASGDRNVDMLGNSSACVEACSGEPQSSGVEAMCEGDVEYIGLYLTVSNKLCRDATPIMFQICNFVCFELPGYRVYPPFLFDHSPTFLSSLPAHHPLRNTLSSSIHHRHLSSIDTGMEEPLDRIIRIVRSSGRS